MIQITPQLRILVALEAADFRKGIDGLARLCKQELASDPFSGTAFVFRNRRRTAVKVLIYDGQGFWLCQKRLSTGRFRHWPGHGEGGVQRLRGAERPHQALKYRTPDEANAEALRATAAA
ncbi:MAG: hypothetical protein AMXMBFR7_52760 [Planctomycetota bacterium]